MLIELIGIPIRVKDYMSSCDKANLARVIGVRDEKSTSSLNEWHNFSTDGETEGSGIGGGDRLVHLGTSRVDDLGLANFNVDIIDTMSRKDTLALSRDHNAILCREGARDDSHPYDSGRGRFISISHANWVQTRTLHPLRVQICNYSGTDRSLPNLSERVQADRTRHLGKKVCFGACGLNPDICARASNQNGLRGQAVVEVLGLDRRRRVRSSLNRGRDSVARQAGGKRVGVVGGHSNTSGDKRGGARHWNTNGEIETGKALKEK